MRNANEPLIRLSKRGEVKWYRAWGIRLCAIVVALLVCSLITMLTTHINPVKVFESMIQGAFGSARKSWVTFRELSVLLLVALAVTPAFRMRFWNIGAEGQVLMGCLASAACMICLGDKLPAPLLVALMVVTSVLAGMLWAVIPALFKAKWNTNETLFTLMMNYVATQLVAFFVIIWEVPKGSGTIGIINQNSEAGWLAVGNKYLLPILVASLITILLYVYMNYTKHGYELAVVGESERTARYVGIKVDGVIIRTMALSGAICGIVGLLLVGAINHTLTTTLSDGRGFTAVLISWMAQFNPFTMIFSSLLIVFLDRGASEIATAFKLNESFSDILTGVILFFIIGCEFFINYRISFPRAESRKNAQQGGAEHV